MLASLGRALRAPVALRTAPMMARAMATGPAKASPAVSDEMLEKLSGLTTQALVDGLWVMGWPPAMVEGARGLKPGQKCAGETSRPARRWLRPALRWLRLAGRPGAARS